MAPSSQETGFLWHGRPRRQLQVGRGGYRPPLFKGSKDVGDTAVCRPLVDSSCVTEPSRMETHLLKAPASSSGVILIASTVLLFSPMLLGLKVSNLVI